MRRPGRRILFATTALARWQSGDSPIFTSFSFDERLLLSDCREIPRTGLICNLNCCAIICSFRSQGPGSMRMIWKCICKSYVVLETMNLKAAGFFCVLRLWRFSLEVKNIFLSRLANGVFESKKNLNSLYQIVLFDPSIVEHWFNSENHIITSLVKVNLKCMSILNKLLNSWN